MEDTTITPVLTGQTNQDSQPAIGVQDPFGIPLHRHNGLDSPQVQEFDLLMGDNTSNDVSTSKHGFVPKAPNDTTKFLRGDGAWAKVINTIQTYTPAGGGTAVLNLSLGNIHHVTMPAGNITIALSGETTGQCFIVRLLQDSGGGRTVTWFTTIKWAGGSAPLLTTTGNRADTVGFEVTSAGNYDGFIVGQNI